MKDTELRNGCESGRVVGDLKHLLGENLKVGHWKVSRALRRETQPGAEINHPFRKLTDTLGTRVIRGRPGFH